MKLTRLALTALLALAAARADDVNVALAANGATITADSFYTGSPDDKGGAAAPEKLIDGIIRQPADPPGANRWHSALAAPHPHWVWGR